jgi:hypothetical protein
MVLRGNQRRVWLAVLAAVFASSGCDGDSPTAISHPPSSGWIKESGTLTGAYLEDAWASPSGSIFIGSSEGELLRFDGATWTGLPRLYGPIMSLFGFSDHEIFAAAGTIHRYNGREWIFERVEPGGYPGVTALWGTDADTMFGVGYGLVVHRVRDHWEHDTSPTARGLVALWGSSAHQVFAVGDAGRIIEYDGRTWSNIESNVELGLRDIWGRNPTDIYAVGVRSTMTHFDGKHWQPVRVPAGVQDNFEAIWGNAYATYIVGGSGSVYEYRNSTFTSILQANNSYLLSIAGSSRAGLVVGGVSGVTFIRQRGAWQTNQIESETNYRSASMAADGTLFVTGYDRDGGFVRSRRGNEPWVDRATPYESVEEIWAADHDHAFGLRQQGGIHRLVGATWDFVPAPGFDYGQELIGFDHSQVAFVADSLAWWFDGSSWTVREIAGGVRATDIWGFSPDSVYVTSGDGRVYSWDGWSWNLMTRLDYTPLAITGTSSDDIWVLTHLSHVHHFDGSDWTTEEPATYFDGREIVAVGANDVFMIGWRTGVARYDGVRWSVETPPCAQLHEITGVSGTPVFAVGDASALLRFDR